MRKNEINALLRSFAEELPPTPIERNLVTTIYESVKDVLGQANCLQIGSYPRFTSVTPLHDLDVLYILGQWEPSADPSNALTDLQAHLETSYTNPTSYEVKISRQTHSITLQFSEQSEEIFSVDIVPAYIFGTNEFRDPMYVVPEIATKSHGERKRLAGEIAKGTHQMQWIKSDPRGYITVATRLNSQNEDFRKAVKIVKGWRSACKAKHGNFPLKAFHLEQIITEQFKDNVNLEIFDAIFEFFLDLPRATERKQIPDRANPTQFIDSYVEGLTDEDKEFVSQARDMFLIQLEELAVDASLADLITGDLRERQSFTEAYLFDQSIPMLTETEFSIVGRARQSKYGSFREKILDAVGLIDIDREIDFSLHTDAPHADLYKWKVKNDDSSPEPRGEITDHHTFHQPENTKFKGNHYVEAFAIKNGVCIGRSRQNVILERTSGH